MKLERYIYSGRQRTSITIPPEKDGDAPISVALIPGCEVSLPPEMPYVKRGIKKGTLTLVPAAKPRRKTTTTTGTDGGDG